MNDYEFLILNLIKAQTVQLRTISNYRSFLSLVISNQLKQSEVTIDQMRNLQLEILDDQKTIIQQNGKSYRQLNGLNEDSNFNKYLQELKEETAALSNDHADKELLSYQVLEMQVRVPLNLNIIDVLQQQISQNDQEIFKNQIKDHQNEISHMKAENINLKQKIDQLEQTSTATTKLTMENDFLQKQIENLKQNLDRLALADDSKENTIKILQNTIDTQNLQLNQSSVRNSIDSDILAMFFQQISNVLNDQRIELDEDVSRASFVKAGKRTIKHLQHLVQKVSDFYELEKNQLSEISQLKDEMHLLVQQQGLDSVDQVKELNQIIQELSQQNEELIKQQEIGEQAQKLPQELDQNAFKEALSMLKDDLKQISIVLNLDQSEDEEFNLQKLLQKCKQLASEIQDFEEVKLNLVKCLDQQQVQLDEIKIIKSLVGCEN